MGRLKIGTAGLCLGLLAFTILGCSKENEEEGGLAGKVTIDGSSTVFPISEGIAKAFKGKYPGVDVTVGKSGTGGGFKRFDKNESDISDASRPIKPDENARCIENKVEYIELPVAYDGLTIVVNPENTWVKQFTVDDLKKIFLDKSITSWKQVNSDWDDEPLKIYAPGTDSGTFDYFQEVVADGKKGLIRSDMSVSEDDNVLVTGVENNKGAIGFFGASYYFTNKDSLRAIPIVNSDGKAMLPSSESIESGEYNPFSRPLFIYVNLASLKRPEMKKFVDFYLENAAKTAEQVKYVALPQDIYDRAKQHLKDRLVGTHFLDKDDQKRKGPLAEIYNKENLPNAKPAAKE